MDKGEIIARLAELADNEFICWKLLEKHGLAGSDEVEILFTEEYVDYISKEEAMQASLPEHRNTLLARCRAIDKERRSCPAIARALKDKYIPCTLLSDNIEAYKLILRRRNYYVPACHLSRLFSGVGHRVLYDLLRQQQIKKSDFISMEKIENIKRSLSGAVTVQEAALDLHVTTRTVYRKAKELGITIKSFGMSADEFGKLKRRLIGGPGAVTVQEAALDLHVARMTVYRKAKELGITIKSFGMSADEFGKLSADCSLQH